MCVCLSVCVRTCVCLSLPVSLSVNLTHLVFEVCAVWISLILGIVQPMGLKFCAFSIDHNRNQVLNFLHARKLKLAVNVRLEKPCCHV